MRCESGTRRNSPISQLRSATMSPFFRVSGVLFALFLAVRCPQRVRNTSATHLETNARLTALFEITPQESATALRGRRGSSSSFACSASGRSSKPSTPCARCRKKRGTSCRRREAHSSPQSSPRAPWFGRWCAAFCFAIYCVALVNKN